MERFLFILATLISVNSFARQAPLRVNEWKSYPIPSNTDSLLKYNYSKDWYVTLKKNKIYASIIKNRGDTIPFKITVNPRKSVFDKFYGEQHIVKVSDGFLIGFYAGEWGGSLYWFSEDGKQNYKISDHMVIQFIKRERKLYAIEGLAHMGTSYGNIIELNKVDGKWIAKEYLRLPLAPAGITLYDANFIVITSDSLLQINKDATITTLIEKGFWKIYLYPRSENIKIKKNIAYFGMRGGIFKYSLTTENQEWLMPY
jgi:hypothetical protein